MFFSWQAKKKKQCRGKGEGQPPLAGMRGRTSLSTGALRLRLLHTSLPEYFARELRLYSVHICLPEYERDGLISFSVNKAHISYLELIWRAAVSLK